MERINSLDDIMQYATRVVTEQGNEYFEFPCWFKRLEDGTLGVYWYPLLPADLKQFLVKAHMGEPNPQPITYR